MTDTLDEIARKTNEIFASLLLMRDFHGSGDAFQEHFERTVAHVRERALSWAGRNPGAQHYFEAFANALVAWNKMMPAKPASDLV